MKKKKKMLLLLHIDKSTFIREPTSSAPAHKSQIVEPGYLVFHNSRGISELGGVVLVVAGHDGNHSPIWYLSEGYNLHKTGNTEATVAHQKHLRTENICSSL